MTKGFSVFGRDFYGQKFLECEVAFIADAVKVYNSFDAWYKELIDNTTGEVLAHFDSREDSSYTVLNVK